MNRQLFIAQNEPLELAGRIGVGGEGEVFDVAGRPQLVAKLYYEAPSEEKIAKLAALIAVKNERLSRIAAWPVELLHNKEGRVVGFAMNKVAEAAEVHTLHSPRSRLQKFPEASWAFLVHVAANIARAVAVVHEHNLVVGDVNPKNILVTRQATTCLLDCDSFQIDQFRCEAGFPEYTPPELQDVVFKDVDRATNHDAFGLAVIVFQLLFLGRHPFSGRFIGEGEMPLARAIKESRFAYGDDALVREMQPPPGTLPLDAVPAEVGALFRRAFLTEARPAATEWVAALEALARSLRRCEAHTGHQYFAALNSCPWCELEGRTRLRLFNFLLPAAGRDGFKLDEIWKEIESVTPPAPMAAQLATQDNTLMRQTPPSPEAGKIRQRRLIYLWTSILVALVAGVLIGWLTSFPVSWGLLLAVGFVVRTIARLKTTNHKILALAPMPIDDFVINQFQEDRAKADAALQQTIARWNREASERLFDEKVETLQARREMYQQLDETRARRLRELEESVRAEHTRRTLSEFEVERAQIKGVGTKLKASLLANGVATAADIEPEKLAYIHNIGDARKKSLLLWREDLERRIVYTADLLPTEEARAQIEREIDAARVRLEHELAGGAYYLRRMAKEIETNRVELLPALAHARRTFTQAEKDWKTVSKRNSAAWAVVVLLLFYFVGAIFEADFDRMISGSQLEERRIDKSVQHSRPVSEVGGRKGIDLYYEGVEQSNAGNFDEAAHLFQQAVEVDPKLNGAFEELGYALYQLKYDIGALSATERALQLAPSFDGYYIRGLVFFRQQKWGEAIEMFTKATAMTINMPLEHRQLDAYFKLRDAYKQNGTLESAIEELEHSPEALRPISKQIALINLYLAAGNEQAANEHFAALRAMDQRQADYTSALMNRAAL